ncbi:NAD(P)-binding protein [Polyplosphaeria fusca]|uniref:NAD(P)-binding protein n=1 Tax=Polyplosphaeria fusca TaxID=682080 RepID=A0A9P4QU40_9PLEO|nr:NAD(P)-binding protein [Polyplosphaeria fusca]
MSQQTVLVIGGAGAQGVPIVKALSNDPKYAVRVLTRNRSSPTAQELLQLPNVSIVPGDASTESDLRNALQGVDLAFVNTNSNALGIRAEIFWGTRIYDLAREAGVKHYIWSSLEDVLALSNYDPACRVGHYEGKSRVASWLRSKPQTPMKWSILTTGPYIEMLHELLRPETRGDETVFRLPLGEGAVPFVHLEDVGESAKWLFDHPDDAAGFDLKTSVEHASGPGLAEAFTAVTGKPARFEHVDEKDWVVEALPAKYKMGQDYPGNTENDSTLLTYGENFINWWHLYQRSGENKGLIRADYEWLDRNLPGRVKSVEEWMRKVGYTGEKRDVLKTYAGR